MKMYSKDKLREGKHDFPITFVTFRNIAIIPCNMVSIMKTVLMTEKVKIVSPLGNRITDDIIT